ncbi:MAG: chromosome segregation protein ScpA [Cytophagales bacterium]|nr:MAG: chromosome segregation protein ScpA [Cytophagales bacterium]
MSFEIQLPLFKGPFDLLLFFIERDELDIHDIPIYKITNDFLSYIHSMEQMNIEIASEFILVAATLMRIKAKMLLPRPELDEAGKEIDPREELVAHLLEYKRYKSVIQELMELEQNRLLQEKRGNIAQELKHLAEISNVETELQELDLFKILKVYEKAILRYKEQKEKPTHFVEQYPFTIAQQKEYLMNKLRLKAHLTFEEILADFPTKIALVYNFLAVLELLQIQLISIVVGEGFNNFWIEEKNPNQEVVFDNVSEFD